MKTDLYEDWTDRLQRLLQRLIGESEYSPREAEYSLRGFISAIRGPDDDSFVWHKVFFTTVIRGNDPSSLWDDINMPADILADPDAVKRSARYLHDEYEGMESYATCRRRTMSHWRRHIVEAIHTLDEELGDAARPALFLGTLPAYEEYLTLLKRKLEI